MFRTLLSPILLLSLVPVALAQTPGEEFLPAGTILHCTLDEPNLSSRTAELGDPILCHTGTLPALGHSVSYRGADLAGHFQEYRDPGHFFAYLALNLYSTHRQSKRRNKSASLC